MSGFQKFTHRCANFLLSIGAVGLLLMTVIVGWQVFGRYVLNQSPDWSEQSALVLMIWYVSLAAAAGVQQGFHIRIIAFENALPNKGKRVIRTINHAVVAVCGLVTLVWGMQLVFETWTHIVPTLPLTRGMVYLAIPLAGAMILLFSIERLVLELSGRADSDDSPPEESNPNFIDDNAKETV